MVKDPVDVIDLFMDYALCRDNAGVWWVFEDRYRLLPDYTPNYRASLVEAAETGKLVSVERPARTLQLDDQVMKQLGRWQRAVDGGQLS